MSFYSYKNCNSEACPGNVSGNILTGLNKKVCIQVKNVYDSCLSQQQLEALGEILDVMLDNALKTCKKGCDENDQKTCGQHSGI